jgi:hypothetical protein
MTRGRDISRSSVTLMVIGKDPRSPDRPTAGGLKNRREIEPEGYFFASLFNFMPFRKTEQKWLTNYLQTIFSYLMNFLFP